MKTRYLSQERPLLLINGEVGYGDVISKMSFPAINLTSASDTFQNLVTNVDANGGLIVDYSMIRNYELEIFYDAFGVKTYEEFSELSKGERFNRLSGNPRGEVDVRSMSPDLSKYSTGAAVFAAGEVVGDPLKAFKTYNKINKLSKPAYEQPLERYAGDKIVTELKSGTKNAVISIFTDNPETPAEFRFYGVPRNTIIVR